MSNNKQTAVEWLFHQLWEEPKDKFTWYAILEKAKEMEKREITDAIKTEIKLIGNYFDVSKLDVKEQSHHIRFTSILKDRFDYYNETYGKNTNDNTDL